MFGKRLRGLHFPTRGPSPLRSRWRSRTTLLLTLPALGLTWVALPVHAAAPPKLYAYEPQNDGNCRAPCNHLTVWVEPGSNALDASTASLGLLDVASGATVGGLIRTIASDAFSGISSPISRFTYAGPGLQVGHTYQAQFSVLDSSGTPLSLTYRFLVNQLSIPTTEASIPATPATTYAWNGTSTDVTFKHVLVTIPNYDVRISGTAHPGLGFLVQDAHLANAVVTYEAGGVRSVGGTTLHDQAVYSSLTVADTSKTDYDITALGTTQDAGALTLRLPGNVTAASISMAPTQTLSLPGVFPGLEPVVPINGYQSPTPDSVPVCTLITCVEQIVFGEAGFVEVDAWPLFAPAQASANIVQNQAAAAKREALEQGTNRPAGPPSTVLTYFPELCQVAANHEPYACRVQGVHSIQVTPPNGIAPVYQQADFSRLCGATLSCAETAPGADAAVGQSVDANFACGTTGGDGTQAYCGNSLYVGYNASTWFGAEKSGEPYSCSWNGSQCLYISVDGTWADDGWENSGSDTNNGRSNDGFQIGVQSESIGGLWALYGTNHSDASYIEAKQLWNDNQCPSQQGGTQDLFNNSSVQGYDDSNQGKYNSWNTDLWFNEEWYSNWGSDNLPHCVWQTIGGGVDDTWVSPNNNGCSSKVCNQPLGIAYNENWQTCGWNWSWSLSSSFPWVLPSFNTSCNAQTDLAWYQGSVQVQQ